MTEIINYKLPNNKKIRNVRVENLFYSFCSLTIIKVRFVQEMLRTNKSRLKGRRSVLQLRRSEKNRVGDRH